MKHILAVCATPNGLRQTLSLVERHATVITVRTPEEIEQVCSLERLDVYDMIVMSSIAWRIPRTSPGLVRHFRERFNGPIVAIGNVAEWRSLMRKAGCHHLLPSNQETAKLVHEILFPRQVS
ncbi:hypothetical protein HY630_03305 [Candidatus Uhrbacteria bacterium]|nr:hypothetical protein [Candidatus Uhrbacteria bacterium]